MINLYQMNQMSFDDAINLYRQGHRLAEGQSYMRSLAEPNITCTTQDTDPSHTSWFCFGYKMGPIILGGAMVYLIMRKK